MTIDSPISTKPAGKNVIDPAISIKMDRHIYRIPVDKCMTF